MKHFIQKSLLIVATTSILTSCGPDVVSLATEKADKYLADLNKLDQKQPLSNLILDFSNQVYLNESEIELVVLLEEFEGENLQLFDKTIADKITSKKDEITNKIQSKKKEGFDFMQNKTWIVKDKSENNYYKALFTVSDDKLVFENISGKYPVSLNEGADKCKIGDTEVTFEKISDSELKVTNGTNTGVFVDAESDDLILGKFSGNIKYYGSSISLTINVKSLKKATLYMKGPGGSESYSLVVKSKGNGKYSFTDKSGDVINLKYKDNRVKGTMGDINLNLSRGKSGNAYYVNSIYDGYTAEDAKKRKSSNTSSSSSSNSDWDEVLVEYEEFIDNYITLLKKATSNPGDMTIIAEYTTYMQQAEKLGRKLSGAGSDLTSSQMRKFTKLQTKLMNAAMDLMKH